MMNSSSLSRSSTTNTASTVTSPASPPSSSTMLELNKLTFQSTLLTASMISDSTSSQLPSSPSSTTSPRAARLDAISARIRAEMFDLDSPINAIVASRSEVETALKRVKELVVAPADNASQRK